MGFLSNFLKSDFEKWIENASQSAIAKVPKGQFDTLECLIEELAAAYEKERQQWIKDGYNGGTGRKTQKMNRLNEELSKRAAEEWENNPNRNCDPNYRWTDANRWDKG